MRHKGEGGGGYSKFQVNSEQEYGWAMGEKIKREEEYGPDWRAKEGKFEDGCCVITGAQHATTTSVKL